MEIKGVDVCSWRAIVADVSNRQYNGNVIVKGDEYSKGSGVSRACVRVESSRGMGAKRGFSGRRTTSACWHVYRDVLIELFERFPNAKVRTALAVYDGKDGFYRNYPATGYINVGSQVQPRSADEMCECDGNGPPSVSEVNEEFNSVVSYTYGYGETIHPRTQAIDEFGLIHTSETNWHSAETNRADYRSDKEMLNLS